MPPAPVPLLVPTPPPPGEFGLALAVYWQAINDLSDPDGDVRASAKTFLEERALDSIWGAWLSSRLSRGEMVRVITAHLTTPARPGHHLHPRQGRPRLIDHAAAVEVGRRGAPFGYLGPAAKRARGVSGSPTAPSE